MPDQPRPLAAQIAASLEEAQAMVDNNRSLCVALLASWVRELKEKVQRQDREHTSQILKLNQRLDLAGAKFREMRDEIDVLKNDMEVKHGTSGTREVP